MTSFCECETCKEIKKRIHNRNLYMECPYCHRNHDSKLACPEFAGTLNMSPAQRKLFASKYYRDYEVFPDGGGSGRKTIPIKTGLAEFKKQFMTTPEE